MPDATITSTASTFGTIAGTFAADQSTITGTITAITGTIDGSVGVPGPQGPAGAAGVGVPAAGTTGQVLQKLSATSYDTGWLTLPADYITSVTAPLDVTSGNLSVNLSAYLPLAGGYITGDIQSSNGSGYRSWNGTNLTGIFTAGSIVFNDTTPGHGSLTLDADGLTFNSSPYKQTTPFLGLAGYATEAWVTNGFYPLAGNPSGFLTDAPSDGSQYARKNAAWDVVNPGDRYLTTSTTSNTLSNTTKTFTIGTGLSYTPTQNITISYDASNHMHGEVLTYNSGTGVLTVDINHHTGSGTYAAWVVNVGGVTPATSVAWGAITGTLSTQTDLQNALDLKLDVTTAASTYYPLVGNPSGFLTSVPAPTLTNLTSDISWDGSANTGRLLIAGVNDIGGGNTEARLNFTSGVPTQPATGDFWTNGTDFFYRESGSTKTIASQSYVSATYQTLAGMSSYLTSATAASTYFTIASAANKADLASPTFTGTPTLPTGTIATTQSPGNNTTAVATTAFVTAAVPAFATSTQSRSATSTTVAQSPGSEMWQMMNPGFIRVNRAGHTYTATGTMGTFTAGWYSTLMNVGAAIASAKYRSFGLSLVDQSNICVSRGYRSYIDFSRYIWCSGRFYTENGAWSDPNVSARFYFGKAENSANGDPARKCFGWSLPGNATAANRNPVLQVHNGTTLTSVATTFAVVGQQYFDWDIVSLGNGTVTLYINGTQYATTSNGPTGDTSYSGSAPVIWQEELVATAVPTLGSVVFSRGQIYIAP